MVVNSTLVNTGLKLTMKTGVDLQGKNVYAVKTMNGIKVNASDADIFEVGLAISNIKTYPLFGIDRVNQLSLVME